MKKKLLTSTALASAAVLACGVAQAAEPPTWKLSGNLNFQFYWIDQDNTEFTGDTFNTLPLNDTTKTTISGPSPTHVLIGLRAWDTADGGNQDHDWYFGVDEAELQLNVDGTADNGLNYGFKIEIQANTTSTIVADEARIELEGSWGTLHLGDEDGAEDIMNYGGENLMGGTGGFDGDQDDYLFVCTPAGSLCVGDMLVAWRSTSGDDTVTWIGNAMAPSYPTIAGDTSDATKISYYTPRFAGFQVGASITPTLNQGDNFKVDTNYEDIYGLGANYNNAFGPVRVSASAVYTAGSSNDTAREDISAWSVGGIVGFGPFSVGANYTDNGDSIQWKAFDTGPGAFISSGIETSYWDVAASFETGPIYLSAGYFASLADGGRFYGDSTYEHIALTADYSVAPGLSVYAEVNLIDQDVADRLVETEGGVQLRPNLTNSTTSIVIGTNVSF